VVDVFVEVIAVDTISEVDAKEVDKVEVVEVVVD